MIITATDNERIIQGNATYEITMSRLARWRFGKGRDATTGFTGLSVENGGGVCIAIWIRFR